MAVPSIVAKHAITIPPSAMVYDHWACGSIQITATLQRVSILGEIMTGPGSQKGFAIRNMEKDATPEIQAALATLRAAILAAALAKGQN